jgi:hypothetical protein
MKPPIPPAPVLQMPIPSFSSLTAAAQQQQQAAVHPQVLGRLGSDPQHPYTCPEFHFDVAAVTGKGTAHDRERRRTITYLTGGKEVGSIGSSLPPSYNPGRAVHFSVTGATRNCASRALVVWRQGERFVVARLSHRVSGSQWRGRVRSGIGCQAQRSPVVRVRPGFWGGGHAVERNKGHSLVPAVAGTPSPPRQMSLGGSRAWGEGNRLGAWGCS